MVFVFDQRPSDSSFVEAIWRTHSEQPGAFISRAVTHWEMVVTKEKGRTHFTVRGPETKASPSPVPGDAEFFGIVFKVGTFMPRLPAKMLVDGAINLPHATSKAFWLDGSAWHFPDFENADTFVERLVGKGVLVRDGVVEAALQGQPQDMSLRNVRRRFLRATGLTPGAIQQIERARLAAALLEQGVSILDTVYETGYCDQPHMTRSLKHLIGHTPAQIARISAVD